jgi:hypothetical protein
VEEAATGEGRQGRPFVLKDAPTKAWATTLGSGGGRLERHSDEESGSGRGVPAGPRGARRHGPGERGGQSVVGSRCP